MRQVSDIQMLRDMVRKSDVELSNVLQINSNIASDIIQCTTYVHMSIIKNIRNVEILLYLY